MARFFPDRPPGTRAVMARTKSRPIRLSAADRQMLTGLTRTGSHPAQQVRRARILLALDENDPDRDGPVPAQAVIAERAGVCTDTIVKVSKAYADRGGDVQATVTRKKRETPPVPPIVTGEVEARVIALACTEPPEGRDRWSLRLLEKHVALTEELPDLDHSTIGRVLKNETAPSSEAVLDDPGDAERGVRRQNGGRPRRLRQALRSCSSGGVHGREALPAARPRSRPDPGRTGTRPQGRLRVRRSRHLRDLRLDPTAGRPQTRGCPAAADPAGLGPRDRSPAHRGLSRGRVRG